jgi:hypothetical protein
MPTKILENHVHPKHSRLYVQLRSNSKVYQALTFLDGKKRQKALKKTTRLTTAFKLAEEWYQDLCRASVSVGRRHPLERLAVEPLLSELFTSYKAALDSPKKRGYAAMKWSAMKDFWATKTPSEITAQTFREFYAWRRRHSRVERLKNHTLHKDMMVVRQILKFAVQESQISSLPAIPKVGKIDGNPRPWLTPQEWKHLREASEILIQDAIEDGEPRLATHRVDTDEFMRFMVDSMCRVDELRNLHFRDCQVETTPQKRKILLAQVTGKRGTRDIVAGSDAAGIYTARLKRQGGNLDALIFEGKYHRGVFRELLKRARLHADAQGFARNFKSLRATAISFAILEGGKNPNLLMIARNAGTSAAMIDMFYAKRLTAHLWKDELGASDRAGAWDASRPMMTSFRRKNR